MQDPKSGQTHLTSLNQKRGSFANENFGMATASAFNSLSLSSEAIEGLNAFSVTTVEDLVGLKKVAAVSLAAALRASGVQDTSVVLRLVEAAEPDFRAKFQRVEQFKYAFGAKLSSAGPRPITLTKAATTTASQPQSEVSLIGPNMPPILNQGPRGTCVAFATCAVLEYELSQNGKGRIDLSEQYQYWNCKQNDGSPGEGTTLDTSFALTQRDGICLERTWPYVSTPNPNNPTYNPAPYGAKAEAGGYKVRQAVEIQNYRTVSALKAEIQNGHPITIGIPVYDSWEENPNCRLTGNISLPLPGEISSAGHAIVLVGYDSNPDFAGGGYFIVRNSWGNTWGVDCPFGAGYGTLPFRYIEQYNHGAYFVRY